MTDFTINIKVKQVIIFQTVTHKWAPGIFCAHECVCVFGYVFRFTLTRTSICMCVYTNFLIFKLKKNVFKGPNSFDSFYCHHKDLSSSSCHAASTDIPDPLSPRLPIIHRLRQVLSVTSHILT